MGIADENAPSGSDGRPPVQELGPLVLAAKTGDPGALQTLLKAVEPALVRYCRGRMGRRDFSYLSADDVAQEACLALCKMLPGYEDRGGSFYYLARAIAANKVVDAYRAVSRDKSEPMPDLPETVLTTNEPETEALQADLGVRLGRLMATLPRMQQEILTSRVMAGLTVTETAAALGTTPGNVRIAQHRALRKLRTMIERDEF
ncbi:sigma-70 family RNA polymerase sigma factor [Amycolatopsis sp. NPDC059657]|uniref:sigma-70 family RNA polymerase sigma factor n=1 Tax=Amycolatopsis sp. NPDC059657 TaxID=3346899 RepID=UPI00366A5A5B